MASLMLLTTIPIQAKAELKNPITATAPAKSPEVESFTFQAKRDQCYG